MEPNIVDRAKLILVGFSFFGDPFKSSAGWTEANEIGRLWKRLMAYMGENPTLTQKAAKESVAYEVHIVNDETTLRGEYEVFVGLEVTELNEVPFDLLVKILLPTKYAVFTLGGSDITSD